jgi:hypothetical protein
MVLAYPAGIVAAGTFHRLLRAIGQQRDPGLRAIELEPFLREGVVPAGGVFRDAAAVLEKGGIGCADIGMGQFAFVIDVLTRSSSLRAAASGLANGRSAANFIGSRGLR